MELTRWACPVCEAEFWAPAPGESPFGPMRSLVANRHLRFLVDQHIDSHVERFAALMEDFS